MLASCIAPTVLFIAPDPAKSNHIQTKDSKHQNLSSPSLCSSLCLLAMDSDSGIPNPFLQIVEHPDGTITRPFVPQSPPNPNPPVLSKDLPLNPSRGTYLRLYLPIAAASPDQKLPVLLFFHGGGFVLFSPSDASYHASCEAMAASLPALVCI